MGERDEEFEGEMKKEMESLREREGKRWRV